MPLKKISQVKTDLIDFLKASFVLVGNFDRNISLQKKSCLGPSISVVGLFQGSNKIKGTRMLKLATVKRLKVRKNLQKN